jgi:predicted SprT family Zn-dependent metalloprotease
MIHLTPSMLEASYELLRTTPPFKRWKLPEADDVEFHVTKHRDRQADCTSYVDMRVVIRISTTFHGRVAALLETMAHEMCHIHQRRLSPGEREHGAAFKRLAAQVCRHHGFDPKTF